MIAVKKTFIFDENFIGLLRVFGKILRKSHCYSLNSSYNSTQIGKLNFVDSFLYYDVKLNRNDYQNYIKDVKEIFQNRVINSSLINSRINRFVYILDQPETEFKEGIFLKLSDDNGCLDRKAELRLMINYETFLFPCCFASEEEKSGKLVATECYYRLSPAILKALALSYSIKFSYLSKDEGQKSKDIDISGFKKYALAYYEQYYLEYLGTSEEKESLKREVQSLRAIKEEKKQEEAATRKAEWDNAGPISKIVILLKRHWKLILLLLFIISILKNC